RTRNTIRIAPMMPTPPAGRSSMFETICAASASVRAAARSRACLGSTPRARLALHIRPLEEPADALVVERGIGGDQRGVRGKWQHQADDQQGGDAAAEVRDHADSPVMKILAPQVLAFWFGSGAD